MAPIPPRPTVISTAVEKSHAGMVEAALWQEISGLRASIDFIYLYLHTDTQPRSR